MSDQDDGIDQARLERLLADPRVIVHRRQSREPLEPFVSELRGLPHVDVLDLLERRDRDDEADFEAPPER